MKQDGYCPVVEREGEISYAELRQSLAYKIGMEDFQVDIEAGLMPDTIIFFGAIPPKYLKVIRQ